MLLSTIVPAIFIVCLVYLLVVRYFRWRWLSYGLTVAIAAVFLAKGGIHADYTGMEVAGLGCLTTWFDPMGYWKSKV